MATRGEAAMLTAGWEADQAADISDPPVRSRQWAARPVPAELQRQGFSPTQWFAGEVAASELYSLGFRLAPGGTHLARTLMLAELGRLLNAAPDPRREDLSALVLDQNVLHKRTGSGRRLSLRHLRELYGLGESVPISRAMLALWAKAGTGQPMLALLAALAREPLVRDSAELVLPQPVGAVLNAASLVPFFERRYPGRYTSKMLRSLSQNCASSWTQAGHLKGKVRKLRACPVVSPAVAAYAGLLGTLAGFGGRRCSPRPGSRSSTARGRRSSPCSKRRKAKACCACARRAGLSTSKSGATWRPRWRYPSLPTTDELLRHFERQAALPWRDDLAPEYRVWILHYDPALERRVRRRVAEFEAIARRHAKGWFTLDLAALVAPWFAAHPLFAALVEEPDELSGLLKEFGDHVTATVRERLAAVGPADILALLGAGALFGLMRLSALIETVASAVPGRLLIFFPGRFEGNSYRLLDARGGWNYRATPIPG
jgi:hypothetical protein